MALLSLAGCSAAGEVAGSAAGEASGNSALTGTDAADIITKGGTYTYSGDIAKQVRVNAPGEEVVLVLENARIDPAAGPAIRLEDALSVIIEVPEGSSSTIIDSAVRRADNYAVKGDFEIAPFAADEDNIPGNSVIGNPEDEMSDSADYVTGDSADYVTGDSADYETGNLADEGSESGTSAAGCIYAKCDVTIQGGGCLNISGYYKDGIQAKDKVIIDGAELNISAKRDGIRANDGINISEAIVSIESERHGLVTRKEGKNDKGLISISDSGISIIAGGYGIKSKTDLIMDNVEMNNKAVLAPFDVSGESTINDNCTVNE